MTSFGFRGLVSRRFRSYPTQLGPCYARTNPEKNLVYPSRAFPSRISAGSARAARTRETEALRATSTGRLRCPCKRPPSPWCTRRSVARRLPPPWGTRLVVARRLPPPSKGTSLEGRGLASRTCFRRVTWFCVPHSLSESYVVLRPALDIRIAQVKAESLMYILCSA